MSEQNKEIIQKVNKAFATGDINAFLDHCTDSFTWISVGEKTVSGKEAVREWMATMKLAEPPVFSVNAMVAEGDYVVVRGEMTMKTKDGKVADYSYCDNYKFIENKIAELVVFVIKASSKESHDGQ